MVTPLAWSTHEAAEANSSLGLAALWQGLGLACVARSIRRVSRSGRGDAPLDAGPLRGLWSDWRSALHVVQPDTVIRWHRAGFRILWRWRSGRRSGRAEKHAEARVLARRMARGNPTWGAPRIYAELTKLGFVVSERSVSRWLPRRVPRHRPVRSIQSAPSAPDPLTGIPG
jgi:hypothetical protein